MKSLLITVAATVATLGAGSVAGAAQGRPATLSIPGFQAWPVRPVHHSLGARHSFSGLGESVLYNFQGGLDGELPAGTLIRRNGVLYGTTIVGGTGPCSSQSGPGCGTVFKLTPTLSGYMETVLYSFQGGADGEYPEAGLFSDASGALYGTTIAGGTGSCSSQIGFGCGTVFKLTPAGSGYTETVAHSFAGGADGTLPAARLIADKNGALYGTTLTGGPGACTTIYGPGCGTVFKLTPAGSGYAESVLYAFQGGNDGAFLYGDLIRDFHGAIYGTTAQGGGSLTCNGGCGTVFKLTPAGAGYTESLLHVFAGTPSDGQSPQAGLVAHGDVLFGTTASGGSAGFGTVFSITPAEHVLYSFQGNADGSQPSGPIIVNKYGTLFGMTTYGGGSSTCSFGCGTVFKLSSNGASYAENVIYAFQGGADGAAPETSGIVGVGNVIYGTTLLGGPTGFGTVFELQTGFRRQGVLRTKR